MAASHGDLRRALPDQCHVGAGAADVDRDQVVIAREATDECRAARSRGWSRERKMHRLAGGRIRREDAAIRFHHEKR